MRGKKRKQGYEGVEPYIYDLQSKCIALCNIPLFFVSLFFFSDNFIEIIREKSNKSYKMYCKGLYP